MVSLHSIVRADDAPRTLSGRDAQGSDVDWSGLYYVHESLIDTMSRELLETHPDSALMAWLNGLGVLAYGLDLNRPQSVLVLAPLGAELVRLTRTRVVYPGPRVLELAFELGVTAEFEAVSGSGRA